MHCIVQHYTILSEVYFFTFSFNFTHSTRQAKANVGHDETEPVSIMHPEAAKAESIIRNAWAESKLVADQPSNIEFILRTWKLPFV